MYDYTFHKKRNWKYYEVYLKRFKKNPKVIFEMGSGIGLFLKACLKNNVEAIGCELSEEGVTICKSCGLNIYKHDLSFPLLFAESGFFDAVFCNQVIEHVDNDA